MASLNGLGVPDSSRVFDWVIVGGESGPKARPMDLAWARSLRDQCAEAGVPFFFKQIGGRGPKKSWAPIPEDLQIKQWPEVPQAAAW